MMTSANNYTKKNKNKNKTKQNKTDRQNPRRN